MHEQMKPGGGGCTTVGAMQGDACAGGCDPTRDRVADGPTAIAAPASRRPAPSRTRLAPQVRTRSHRLRPQSLVPPSAATSRGCASSTCHTIQGKARRCNAMLWANRRSIDNTSGGARVRPCVACFWVRHTHRHTHAYSHTHRHTHLISSVSLQGPIQSTFPCGFRNWSKQDNSEGRREAVLGQPCGLENKNTNARWSPRIVHRRTCTSWLPSISTAFNTAYACSGVRV